MLKSVEVRQYMGSQPVTVKQDMNISEAAQTIVANKVSGVAVVDDEDNLVGMLSELDCLKSIVNSVYADGNSGAALVKDVMTREVEVNHPHDDIVDVAASMLDHKHRRRPIIADGKLVGQITCRQILKAVKAFGWKSQADE